MLLEAYSLKRLGNACLTKFVLTEAPVMTRGFCGSVFACASIQCRDRKLAAPKDEVPAGGARLGSGGVAGASCRPGLGNRLFFVHYNIAPHVVTLFDSFLPISLPQTWVQLQVTSNRQGRGGPALARRK